MFLVNLLNLSPPFLKQSLPEMFPLLLLFLVPLKEINFKVIQAQRDPKRSLVQPPGKSRKIKRSDWVAQVFI